jgi:phosphoribosylformimino-5-aminoimidazole carboxamide ribotide isomerase
MIVIPSVDIMKGKCVQLVGGRAETKREYGDPIDWAKRWEKAGAKLIHLVDLDAAMGTGDNRELLRRVIQSVGIAVQVGGGIRSSDRARFLIDAGATRLVVGTAAVKAPGFVGELVRLFGGKQVLVALDTREGKVAVRGWKETSNLSTIELAKFFEGTGVGGFLFTSIDSEGTMRGPDVKAIRSLVKAVRLPVIASGGIGSLEDITKVRKTGVQGIVIGMALYEGKFTLKQAMEVAGNEESLG